MIPRYTPQRMGSIWAEANRLRIMVEVELLACEALAQLGRIPQSALKRIKAKARVSLEGIQAREKRTQHDVVAFLEELAAGLGSDARYLHLGLTSSDVLDTATALQLKAACDLILEDLARLKATVRRQARRYETLPCIGRTHGVHAEPTTFGLKLAVHYAELKRAQGMLKDARRWVAVGKISGAVGTYAHLDPWVERYVCRKLGLAPALISTQIVPRDAYAVLLCRLAIVGGMLERMATEIRHLQRTEVLEVEEPFGEGQAGSSAMPHKRNPVSAERVSGLARLLRAYALTALENIALWHERDISHSSTERVILPDATCVLDFMIQEMTRIIGGLNVHPDRMRRNMDLTRGLIFSESVLLALMEKGLPRPDAYRLVQRHAMAAWRGEGDFFDRLKADPNVTRYLSPKELAACFDEKRHLRWVRRIFKRLGL